MDQSRPSQPSPSAISPSNNDANVVAIKLLQLHRELNLMRYHGIQNYMRQWWLTRKSSGLINNSNGNTPISTNNNNNIVDDYGQTKLNSRTENKKSVARVAFMITADMRNKLSSNLGYTAQDIRSLTPQEAMLLLEHGVMKDGVVDGKDISFRARLNELMKNEDADSEQIISMNFEQQTDDTAECTRNNEIATTNTLQSLSPEEAHDMHAKPDVAMALLSADIATDATLETEKVVVFHARGRMLEDASTQPNNASTIESTKILNNTGPEEEKQRISPARSHDSLSSTTLDSSYPTQLIEVTPRESEGLGMKPDVAAAILTSHRRQQGQQNNHHTETRPAVGDGGPLYWYEVIDRLPRKYSSATSNRTTKQYEQDGEEQVIAIFSTEKEALECARIKQSIRANRSNKGDETAVQSEDCDERYLVRRRLK